MIDNNVHTTRTLQTKKKPEQLFRLYKSGEKMLIIGRCTNLKSAVFGSQISLGV